MFSTLCVTLLHMQTQESGQADGMNYMCKRKWLPYSFLVRGRSIQETENVQWKVVEEYDSGSSEEQKIQGKVGEQNAWNRNAQKQEEGCWGRLVKWARRDVNSLGT